MKTMQQPVQTDKMSTPSSSKCHDAKFKVSSLVEMRLKSHPAKEDTVLPNKYLHAGAKMPVQTDQNYIGQPYV